MPRYHRCCWYDPAAKHGSPGHPLYVFPHQGAGRVDDPERQYRVLYLGTDEVGCVAEAFGSLAVWTPAMLAPPSRLPRAVRALVTYDVRARVCDLDDPERLVELGLRPSQVVTPDRAVTQAWARRIYDADVYDGVSWWSRRDARWTSVGLWDMDVITVVGVTPLPDVAAPAIQEAASVLLRPISR